MNKKPIYFALFLLLFSVYLIAQENQDPAESDLNGVLQSVVFIENEGTSQEPAYLGGKNNIRSEFGSGFVIADNRILTAAHVVEGSKYLKVKHFNSGSFYTAQVEYIGRDCDLAVLKVDNPEFFKGSSPLTISDATPYLGAELLILGYPEGIESLSLEKAIVNHVDRIPYYFSGLDVRKAIRVEARILPGYSGGPALYQKKVAGITSQVNTQEGKTAYLIPPEIIQHFLTDISDGRYDGIPFTGLSFQNGYSSALKEYLRVPKGLRGVLINNVYAESTLYGLLQERDFLYRVDDYFLNEEAGILSESNLNLADVFEKKQFGDPIRLFYFRDGKNYKLDAKLGKSAAYVAYRNPEQDLFVSAGFMFEPMTRKFLEESVQNVGNSIRYYFSYFIQDELFHDKYSGVVLSKIFFDPLNSKYKDYRFRVLETLNGSRIQSMEDLRSLWFKYSDSSTIVLKFRDEDLPLILNPETIRTINIRVQKRYGIEASTSNEK